MEKVLINNFRVSGDMFYTEAVKFYLEKLGIESVSSFEEIDCLENKVLGHINSDEKSQISSKIDKAKLVSQYFFTLRVELRNSDY